MVTSAGSLKHSRLGAFIDEHDIVLRFNDAPTEGHVEDVGKKTTIRIVNSQVTTSNLFFYSVAAQMYEFSYTENPPNCVGGIRELFICLVIASLLLALLLNTSRSLLLLHINCLVSTVVTHS